MKNHKHRFRLLSSNKWFHRLGCAECGRMCCWTRYAFARATNTLPTFDGYAGGYADEW